jgi:phage terminase small subunit
VPTTKAKPKARKVAKKRAKAGTSQAAAALRREKFKAAYVSNGGNATQAAIRAGYSAKTAMEQSYQLLQKTSVAEAVAEAQAERAAKCDIDAAWVLREAKRTYLACHDADKLSEAVSALKLVGAHVDVQAFKERTAHEHTGKDGGAILLEQATNDAHALRSRLIQGVVTGAAAGGTGAA